MRVECNRGAAAWLVGTLPASMCRGMECLHPEVMALSESFSEPLLAGNQKASLASLSP